VRGTLWWYHSCLVIRFVSFRIVERMPKALRNEREGILFVLSSKCSSLSLSLSLSCLKPKKEKEEEVFEKRKTKRFQVFVTSIKR
jgi:hypothetical protein